MPKNKNSKFVVKGNKLKFGEHKKKKHQKPCSKRKIILKRLSISCSIKSV